MGKKGENELFTNEEIEEMLFSATSDPVRQVKSKLQELVQQYPIHTLGLVFAFGLLLGVAFSGSNSRK